MASECGILCTDYPHDCSGFGYTADGDCILFSDSGNMKVKLLNAAMYESLKLQPSFFVEGACMVLVMF